MSKLPLSAVSLETVAHLNYCSFHGRCAVPRETVDANGTVLASVFEDDQTVDQAIRLLENITALNKALRDQRTSMHGFGTESGEAEPMAEERPAVLQPWFLAVGFRKPHLNWRFPSEFLELYPTNLSQVLMMKPQVNDFSNPLHTVKEKSLLFDR